MSDGCQSSDMLFLNVCCFLFPFDVIATILLNPNFELDSLSQGTYKFETLTDWTCSTTAQNGCSNSRPCSAGPGGCVIVSSSDSAWGGGGAPSGSYYVSVQSGNAGWNYLEQAVTIPAQSILSLSFYARLRPNNAGAITGLSLLFGTQNLDNFVLTTTWTMYSILLPVSASAATANLQFLGYSQAGSCSGDCTFQLDKMEVTQVCPPGSCDPQSRHPSRR